MKTLDQYLSPDGSGYVRPLSLGEHERYGHDAEFGFFLPDGLLYAWGCWGGMVELEEHGYDVHVLH